MQTISPEVRAVLERAHFADGVLRLPAQLDRALYVAVNKALEALGGKWNRGAGGHRFAGDAATKLAAMLSSGVVPPKNPDAFFPTPREVVAEMFALAEMDALTAFDRPTLLEPSAGEGAIAIEARRMFPHYLTHCVEVNQERARHLSNSGLQHVWNTDFLTWDADGQEYDRIVMNPPFNVDGDAVAWLTHIVRALELLHPDGILVSVVPSGYLYRDDRRHRAFRDGIADTSEYRPLDDKSFASSGTGVNAGLLRINGIASRREMRLASGS